MQADEGASAFACTLDKIGHDEKCTFEGKQEPPGPGQARANTRAAQDAARGCDLENDSARKECERGIRQVSESRACTLQGAARLIDDQGKLTAEASRCVVALRAVFNRVAQMDGAAGSPCCECLATARCGVPASECSREVLELKPSRKLSACLGRSCSDECSFLIRSAGPAEDDAPPAVPGPKSHRASTPAPHKI